VKREEELANIEADPGQIQQIVMNLVVNAVDAMPDGGKLTISVGNVEVDQEYEAAHADIRAGRYVVLAVSDTGLGMDAATQERIFEPFFTTKERDRGTGLGLATVYGIVKQHGGCIWVYSEEGKGSCFKIHFPVVGATPAKGRSSRSTSGASRGDETIMVVEDNEDVRAFACEALKSRGYDVVEAESPSKALNWAEQSKQSIDLLLTDVIMPGMNGKELQRRLSELHPDLLAVFMSGYPDDIIAHHGMLDDGLAFVEKPFRADTLAQRIRQALDGE